MLSGNGDTSGWPILSESPPERVGCFLPRRSNLLAKRLIQLASVTLLAVVMLGANDPQARFNRDGHNLMCVCGCAEVLLECNHVGCTDSARMIGELRAQLDGSAPGLNGIIPPDAAILNWFAGKYGGIVLAAPIRGGFDNVAWIMPFAVFLLGTVGTALLVRLWTRNRKPVSTPGAIHFDSETRASPQATALRERIRRETEYR
jgi:hypothetical protein